MSSAQPRILIIGSGPSAAFANAAVREAGYTATIIGNKPTHGERHGAFWIQQMPAVYEGKKTYIEIKYMGNRSDYLKKQWGHEHANWPCSFPDPLPEDGKGWRSFYHEQPALDWLSKGGEWVDSARIPAEYTLDYLLSMEPEYDVIFVTLKDYPLWVLGQKHYNSLIAPGALGIVSRKLVPDMNEIWDFGWSADEGCCIYDGRPEKPWTRWSVLENWVTIETPHILWNDFTEAMKIQFYHNKEWKVTFLDDIPPWTDPYAVKVYLSQVSNKIVPVGRWATVNRSALSHEVYGRVSGEVDRRFGRVKKDE